MTTTVYRFFGRPSTSYSLTLVFLLSPSLHLVTYCFLNLLLLVLDTLSTHPRGPARPLETQNQTLLELRHPLLRIAL